MSSDSLTSALARRLEKAIELRPQELVVLAWAWLYVLALMAAYYIIRPVRDTMGVEGGVENLQWLFTGTLLAMLLINPPYAALVRRLPRVRFITLSYLFFVANLVFFIFLLQWADDVSRVWVGRAFFIWVSVFNLFVVSVFWALMADVFRPEQARRLFGLISAGATVGAICGSAIASGLAPKFETPWLLLASAVLLLVAVGAVRRLSTLAPALRALRQESEGIEAQRQAEQEAARPIGGGIMTGITHVLRSPYLLGISLYVLIFTVSSTFLYFQQASIARDYFPDRGSRTAFFANVDLLVNVLTLLLQVFMTGRFIKRFGIAVVISVLPLISLIGFGALALFPTIGAIVVLQVLRRVSNFAFAKPSREMLFTVIPREDKYKAKSVIDTVVYRGGDQLGSWSYALLGSLGAGIAGVSLVAVPLSALWLANAWWLGRRQNKLAATLDQAT